MADLGDRDARRNIDKAVAELRRSKETRPMASSGESSALRGGGCMSAAIAAGLRLRLLLTDMFNDPETITNDPDVGGTKTGDR